ncbi:hypothetical protein [Algoriphagus chordae]|uniref:Pycsar effector protein domain-containing protein n=1 Tax=Algoriphagus chordae TaxID=237019 RepID=A0A2W7QLJ7_9BACT|nr:hypothetical protein [Algoriphagus chordae]PZX46940.1 hypothetical protein LV85_04164 [Algoriphagus chordae]
MKEDLKFLITQTENRIQIVDTKASIILAVYGILLTSYQMFYDLINKVDLILYCNIIIGLLFISSVFLIITIRPFKKFFDYFKWGKNSNDSNDFWITKIDDAEKFSYSDIKDSDLAFENMFKFVAERRVLKYNYFRVSMWFLRISLFLFIYPLVKILFLIN